MIYIGKVGRSHGLKGEFIAHTESGKDSVLEKVDVLYLGKTEQTLQPFKVQDRGFSTKGWKIKLAEFTQPEDIQRILHYGIYVKPENLPQCSENEFYSYQLEGCVGVNVDTNMEVGILSGVEALGLPNQNLGDRWWFKSGTGEFAVPAVKRYIQSVDIPNKKIFIQNFSEIALLDKE